MKSSKKNNSLNFRILFIRYWLLAIEFVYLLLSKFLCIFDHKHIFRFTKFLISLANSSPFPIVQTEIQPPHNPNNHLTRFEHSIPKISNQNRINNTRYRRPAPTVKNVSTLTHFVFSPLLRTNSTDQLWA